MTLFTALEGPFFELSLGRAIRRSAFDPVPEVDAVLLRIVRREEPLVAAGRRTSTGSSCAGDLRRRSGT